MAIKPESLKTFQSIVIDKLREQFPEFATVGANMRFARSITTPAAFVELQEFSYPENIEPTENTLDCMFSLRLIMSDIDDTPEIILEDFAIKFAHYIKNNRWGATCEPAEIIGSSSDDFTPADEAYRAWEVRFKQTISFKGA